MGRRNGSCCGCSSDATDTEIDDCEEQRESLLAFLDSVSIGGTITLFFKDDTGTGIDFRDANPRIKGCFMTGIQSPGGDPRWVDIRTIAYAQKGGAG